MRGFTGRKRGAQREGVERPCGDTKRIHHKDTIESSCRKNLYKHHLSIKKVKANELRQEIGGGTLAGRERILGNREGSGIFDRNSEDVEVNQPYS